MFCSNCGATLKEGTNFCTNCGAKVIVPLAAAEKAAEPVKEAAAETAAEATAAVAATAAAAETTAAAAAEVKEAAEEKAAEVKEAVEEKAAEVKEAVEEKAAEVKEAVEEKAAEVKEAAEEKVAEAKEAVEEKAAEVKEVIPEAPAPAPAPEPAPAPAPAPAPEPAPAPAPAPAAAAPAAAAAAPAAKAAKEVYNGPSVMQSFRTLYGILALLYGVTLIVYQLLPYIGMRDIYMNQKQLINLITAAGTNILLFSFLPGLMSLILCKPTRIKSIILAGCLFLFYTIGAILTVVSAVPQGGLARGIGNLFRSIPLQGMFFALLMAIISIFQPAVFVKKPGAVVAKGWRIAAGIFHIIGGILVILFGVVYGVLYALSVSRFNVSMISPLAAGVLSFLLPGVYMLMTGCVSAGAKRTSSVSLTYLYLITLLRILALTSSSATRYASASEGLSVFLQIINILAVILFVWYLIGFIISFVTMFFKKAE